MAGSKVAQPTETLCARCGHRVALHVREPTTPAPGSVSMPLGRVVCSALVTRALGGERLCGCTLV